MDEQSTFEETIVGSKRKLPSFTLCSMPNGGNKSMESFEDVASEIKNVESNFTIQYNDWNPTIEKERSMVENYNNTLGSVWYFVPKINIMNPSEPTICLIWTPSTERVLKRQIKVLITYLFKIIRELC